MHPEHTLVVLNAIREERDRLRTELDEARAHIEDWKTNVRMFYRDHTEMSPAHRRAFYDTFIGDDPRVERDEREHVSQTDLLDAATMFDFDGYVVLRIVDFWRVRNRSGHDVTPKKDGEYRFALSRDEAIGLAQQMAKGG